MPKASGLGLALLAVFVLAPAPALAQEPQVEFVGDDELSVSSGTATALVDNLTDKSLRVSVELVWTDLLDPDREPVNPEKAFLYTRFVRVRPGARGHVTIMRVTETQLAQAEFNGKLRLRTRSGVQDVLPVSLTVGGPPAVTPPVNVLVSQWDLVDERPGPWSDFPDDPSGGPLPLGSDSGAPEGTVGTTWLDGPGAETLKVTGSVVSDDDGKALALSLEGDDAGHGIYTGTFDTKPGAEGGDMKLTVVRRDGPMLPTLVLLLSLLIAWGLQKWFPGGKTLKSLHTRARAAETALRTHPTNGNLTLTGVDEAVAAAGARRRALARRPVPVTVAELEAAEADVEELETAVSLWGALPGAVTALEAALTKAEEAIPQGPPNPITQAPAFIDEARGLTAGSVDITELPARLAAVRAATGSAAGWGELYNQLLEYGERLEKIQNKMKRVPDDSPWLPQDRALLARGIRLFNLVRWDMWHAADRADLEKRGVHKDLRDAEEVLGMLSGYLEPVPATMFNLLPADAISGKGLSPMALTPLLERIVSGSGDLGGRALAFASSFLDRAATWVFVLAAVAVSIWGALTTLYFDKPFGTLRDYVGLVVWALGTTAAIDVINGVLKRLHPPEPDAAAAKG
ncbi:MAG TPA: hypothetical protein VG318_17955 [Actinomycetota bacterium]|nr:hypothetical protein [Actinomycetota bacterium]